MEATDYLVIGAGPAGLQLAAALSRAGRSHLLLEAGPGPGTFFRTFPRHRQLISVNKPHTGTDDPELNLRMDWNSLLSDDPELLFTRYTERYFPAADDYVRYLGDFAAAHDIAVRYDTRAVRVSRDDAGFAVTDQHGTVHRAARLVVATGVSRPHVPQIPGIEHAEGYETVTVDPDDFTDQRVLILGKGNSAFETAENLMERAAVIHVAGPHSVRLAWRTHFVGHLRAVNNNFLDSYQLKSQNAVLDGHIDRIEPRGDGGFLVSVRFTRADEVVKDIPYDRVIRCTGFGFDATPFDPDCRPELTINDRFPAQTSVGESVNVPGMYFAGTLTQARDFKKSTNGFIHGYRYGVRALHRVLEQRHHGVPWPQRTVAAEPGALADAVLARVNRTSALWQQFGVLADVVTLDRDGTARYLEEVPVDHVLDGGLAADGHPVGDDWWTVTLDYGPGHDQRDPFDIEVGRLAQTHTGGTDGGHYLHPVVRHHHRGELVATHHVTENLENDWTSDVVHREPLRAFLATGPLAP